MAQQVTAHERNMAHMKLLIVKELRAILNTYRPQMAVSKLVKKVLQDHVENLLNSGQAAEVAESIEQTLTAKGTKLYPVQQANIPIRPMANRQRPANVNLPQVFDPVQQANIPTRQMANRQQPVNANRQRIPLREVNLNTQQVPVQEANVNHQQAREFQPIPVNNLNLQQASTSNVRQTAALNASASSGNQVHKKDSNGIRFARLPFYDVEKEILKPKILPVDGVRDGFFRQCSMSFEIPANLIKMLSGSLDDALPRYEIQLRLALQKDGEKLSDDFPNEVKIALNADKVELPLPIRAPSIPGQPVYAKLESRPVNLTPYCGRGVGFSQKLLIEWQQDVRPFVIGIWLVKHISWEMVRDKFLNDGKVQFAETRLMIKRLLAESSNDHEISMDSLKVSLICPYSRTRMLIPIRSRNCSHLQCFDLSNYLQMNKLKPSWKCPVCGKHCPYNSLVVDRYFLEVIQKVTRDTTEVELLQDGNWKSANGEQEADLNNQMQKGILRANTISASTSMGYLTAGTPIVLNRQIEIITLDDTIDQEEMNAETSTPIYAKNTRKRKHDQMTELDPNGQPVITLDDD